MNPDPHYERLREIGWRRPLTDAEQAELREWLAAHPEHHSEAEAEAALTQALANLPEAPMPSNFTSRVLQAVEQETHAETHTVQRASVPWWRAFIPRIAVATLIVGITGFSYWRHQAAKQEELVDTAKNLAIVDAAALEDFEAIRHLSQADDGLLALSDDLLSLK